MKTTPLAKEQKQRREAVRSIGNKNQATHAEKVFQERLIEIQDGCLKQTLKDAEFIRSLDTAADRARDAGVSHKEAFDYYTK